MTWQRCMQRARNRSTADGRRWRRNGAASALVGLLIGSAAPSQGETRVSDQILHMAAMGTLAQMGGNLAISASTNQAIATAATSFSGPSAGRFEFDPVLGTWDGIDRIHYGGPVPEVMGAAADGDRLVFTWLDVDEDTEVLLFDPEIPLLATVPGAAHSVAISGDNLAVGVPGTDDESGAIYLYELVGGTWFLIHAFAGEEYSRLGTSLAMDGLTLVAGAPGEDDDCGAVHVYVRTSSWIHLQTIDCPSQQTNAEFGASLALDGDNLAVGAPFLDRLVPGGANVPDLGGVYTFDVSFLLFELESFFRPAGAAAHDHFGTSVALWRTGGGGLALAAGAPDADDEVTNQGAAYLYLHHGDRWSERLRLADAAPNQQDRLGAAVAIGPMGVLAGEPNNSDAGVTLQGAVAAFNGIVPLFYDSFESEGTSGWSSSTP